MDIGGVALAYRDESKGLPILCLHAVGHSSKDYLSLFKFFTGNARLIAIDFPGHGLSGEGIGEVNSAYYAEITARFLDKLAIRNLIIIGNSIGGAVAMRLAVRPELKVEALVLSNPSGLDDRSFPGQWYLNSMIKFFRKGVNQKTSFQRKFESYYQKVLPTEIARGRREEIAKDAYDLAPLLLKAWEGFKTTEEDLRSLIPLIQCPVFFGWAMRDRYVRFSRNKAAIQQFPNAHVLRYDVGHTPSVEDPKTFIDDVKTFLNPLILG